MPGFIAYAHNRQPVAYVGPTAVLGGNVYRRLSTSSARGQQTDLPDAIPAPGSLVVVTSVEVYPPEQGGHIAINFTWPMTQAPQVNNNGSGLRLETFLRPLHR